MSTRSRIAIKLADDNFLSVYCHNDGYPSWVGSTLLKHFNTKEKAMELIALGNLSSLHESIEKPEGHSFDHRIEGYTVAYGRDRGEKGQEAAKSYSVAQMIRAANDSDGEYIYLFDCETNKWGYSTLSIAYKQKSKTQWIELTPENTKPRR
ncbi:MAG: hypothetical protein PHS30_06910 [Bacteroidales bacterium]|nr:hypothetical protein [Bacteroidales bacterium]